MPGAGSGCEGCEWFLGSARPSPGCQSPVEEAAREVTQGCPGAEQGCAGAAGADPGVMHSVRCVVCGQLTGIARGTAAQSRALRSARSEEQTASSRPPFWFLHADLTALACLPAPSRAILQRPFRAVGQKGPRPKGLQSSLLPQLPCLPQGCRAPDPGGCSSSDGFQEAGGHGGGRVLGTSFARAVLIL